MDYRDYYRLLGVAKTAPQDEIKKAYRKLARKHHPDFNKGNKLAEQKFKEINEAYQVLGDAEKRKKYDQLGADWNKYKDSKEAPFDFSTFTSTGGRQRDFSKGRSSSFSDFFKTFFGGFEGFQEGETDPGPARRATRRPGSSRSQQDEAKAHVSVTPREAVTGTIKHLSVQQEIYCPQCRGKGATPSGTVCTQCLGRGVVLKPESMDVRIPAGVHHDSRIRLRGKGPSVGDSDERGDLYLQVKIQPDQLFRIDGRDLQCEVPLTLCEALLGAEIDVPTAGGKVRMRIPPETQDGQVFRLKGKGLPALGRHLGGDQIVKVRVVIPKNLSEKEKELFQSLSRLRKENPRGVL